MAMLSTSFPTRMSFSTADSGIALYFAERDVQPFAASLQGPVSQTNMNNVKYATAKPKKLIHFEPVKLVAMYDAAVLTQILLQMGVNQEITITLPDTHTWTFWGWIDDFVPENLPSEEPGAAPTAAVNVFVSNLNDSDVETGPVYA